MPLIFYFMPIFSSHFVRYMFVFTCLWSMKWGYAQSPENDWSTLFRTQIKQSNQALHSCQKTVWDLVEGGQNPEKKDIILTPKDTTFLEDETARAVEIVAANAKIASDFSSKTQNDTLIYTVLPQFDEKQPLKLQKILLDKTGKRILYTESHILKKNWLYDEEVVVKVWFDENGHYQKHFLKVYTFVYYIGNTFHVLIGGVAKY